MERRIGIIGVGNMGGAIARGVVKTGLFGPREVVLCDVIGEKAETLGGELKTAVAPNAAETARLADIILIAVKPQTIEECLSQLKETVGSSHLIISIAAGITTALIEGRLGGGARVVRVMPNTPALVGAGASAICSGAHATDTDLSETEKIFAAMGKVYRFDESLMDAVTAVSGSGPAYLFLFAECLERAAVKVGLPEDEAADLAAQTLFGASKLLVESGESASALRAKVTSPGGTTEAAVAVLDKRGFEDSIVAAVSRALDRAKELGGVEKN
ncbi:MAG: pyrroline-5-carboxylate reductase [Candidatus Abyssubacteria bacterium]|nr:pyrroline-5-carboxylate reductase [Candidatus Abyssubacteria bacterium]